MTPMVQNQEQTTIAPNLTHQRKPEQINGDGQTILRVHGVVKIGPPGVRGVVKVGHQPQTILAPIDLDQPDALRRMMIERKHQQVTEITQVMNHLCVEQLTQGPSSAFVQNVFVVLGMEFMVHIVVEDVNGGTVWDRQHVLSMGPLVTTAWSIV